MESAVVLATIGWGQLAIWYATGSNPLPVGYVSSLLDGSSAGLRSGILRVSGAEVFRMNSLAGEPKNLGMVLVIAMLLIQVAARGNPKQRRLKIMWFYFAAAVLTTWSTSAFLLLIAGPAVLAMIPKQTNGPTGSPMQAFRTVSLGLVAVIAFVLAYAPPDIQPTRHLDTGFVSLLESRFDRSPLEDFDAGVAGFLRANPGYGVFGVGLGNIHLYADSYLPAAVRYYAAGTPFVAKSGYLRVISELGVVGLLLLLTTVAVLLRRAQRSVRSLERRQGDAREITACSGLLVLLFAMYMLRGDYVLPEFVLCVACASAAPKLWVHEAVPQATTLREISPGGVLDAAGYSAL
jgi:O-antigen ligase